MGGFNGRAFLLGIEHLDAASQELFEHHGRNRGGRWGLVEQIVDEAMVRMVGAELERDPHGTDSHR